MSQKITLFISSVSSNQNIKKAQQKITMVLESKGINIDVIDIAAAAEDKEKMRELVGDPTALPPQIANNGVYCGDFAAFETAVEEEQLEAFLKLQ